MSDKLTATASIPVDISEIMPALDSFLLKLPNGRADLPVRSDGDQAPLIQHDVEWDHAAISENLGTLQDSDRIAPERFTLEIDNVMHIRNALKLSTKFFNEHRLPWGAERRMESCAHVAEVGTLLALSNAHPEVIQAGFLYPTLVPGALIDAERASTAIEKKFGKNVLELVTRIRELLVMPGEEISATLMATRDENPTLARRLAMLHCAVICARSHSVENDASLTRTYDLCGVPNSLLNQFHIEGGRSGQISPSNLDDSTYSLHDMVDIRNSLRSAAVVFKDTLRKWGPTEKIPLISHAAEVGLLLILADRPRNVVVAGLLHDFLEGYAVGKLHDLEALVKEYGPEVQGLVKKITEPNRIEVHGMAEESRESWLKRKLTIVQRIKESDSEFAELVAATKISTLAAGNKMLFENAPFNKWSNGSCRDNINVFIALCEQCSEKGVHPLLLEQLELETSRLLLQVAGRVSTEAERKAAV